MLDNQTKDTSIIFSIMNRMNGFLYRCRNDKAYSMMLMLMLMLIMRVVRLLTGYAPPPLPGRNVGLMPAFRTPMIWSQYTPLSMQPLPPAATGGWITGSGGLMAVRFGCTKLAAASMTTLSYCIWKVW